MRLWLVRGSRSEVFADVRGCQSSRVMPGDRRSSVEWVGGGSSCRMRAAAAGEDRVRARVRLVQSGGREIERRIDDKAGQRSRLDRVVVSASGRE